MSGNQSKKVDFPLKKQILSKKKFFYFKTEAAPAGDKKTLVKSEFGGKLDTSAIKTLKLDLKTGL